MKIKIFFVLVISLVIVSSITVTANIEINNETAIESKIEFSEYQPQQMENKNIPDISNYRSEWIEYNSQIIENDDSTNLIFNNYDNQEQSTTLFTQSIDLTGLIIQITESTVTQYIQTLTSYGPRVTGTSACDDAGGYIASVFNGMGLDVRIQQWATSGYEGDNIEATLVGEDETSDEIYLVCAHYDSVPGSPGADDNAAGTAAVLASAEVMSQYSFSHTVKFVAFSGEEQGLLGSSVYAAEAAAEGDNIIEVLNADMIGYAETEVGRHTIGIYGSGTIATYSQVIADTYFDLIELTVEPHGASANSDHWSFLQQGYDAAMYHEHEFNPYYHSPQDTIDKMDLNYDMRVTRMIMATLADLSNLEISDDGGGGYIFRPIVSIESPSYGDLVRGTVNITGKASDLFGYIKYVCIQIDHNNWEYAEIEQTQGNYVKWKYAWDTTELTDGSHLISAISINNHGADSPTYFSRVDVINQILETEINGPNQAYVDEEISFQSSTTGGLPPYTYTWDFDDGTISSEQNPTHIYQYPGKYNIKLTVTDSFDNVAYDDVFISIKDETPPTINIINPENGLYINNNKIFNFIIPVIIGEIDIKLDVFDNSGIAYVIININGLEKNNLTDQPYVWTWDETSFGKYTISAVVFDKAGNQANDDIIVWKFL